MFNSSLKPKSKNVKFVNVRHRGKGVTMPWYEVDRNHVAHE